MSIICGGASPGIEPIAANSFTHKTLSGSFIVKNPYLEKLLDKKSKNSTNVWNSILEKGGSGFDSRRLHHVSYCFATTYCLVFDVSCHY